jgi:hypothetical protein
MAKVYTLSSRGVLPKYKIGARLFFSEADIESFIQGCRVEKTDHVAA